MAIHIHHRPADAGRLFRLHAWDGTSTWDVPGVRNGPLIDFQLPDVPNTRKLHFMFHSTDPATHQEAWEKDDYIRRVRRARVTRLWSFEVSARVLYNEPFPPAAAFAAGTRLTFNVITQNRFKGGRLFAWDPYDQVTKPSETFPETRRDDAASVSTFEVTIRPWMTAGFHFKLVGPGNGGNDWEPEGNNRVWRPSDGGTVWLKSGQVSVRRARLVHTATTLEVLFPAGATPPTFTLVDPIEGMHQSLSPDAVPVPRGPAGSPGALFRVATYTARTYPEAVYTIEADAASEPGGVFVRPFPADPGNLATPSRMVLGADGWLAALPAVDRTATLVAVPRPSSAFAGGLTVRVGVGTAAAHTTVPAARQPDGTWRADVEVVQTVRQWAALVPAGQPETRPYDWIDTRRFFIPPAAPATYFTAEGMYGLSTRGRTAFREPPIGRLALMAAAFGPEIAGAAIFGPAELPHGATFVGDEIVFVVHAPHAVTASLVLVDETAAAAPAPGAGVGAPARREVPMELTPDGLYWWCAVPADQAPHGTRYRFAFNDDLEVMDPAARWVADSGDFDTRPGQDPRDPATSWAKVFDPAVVLDQLRPQNWNTMGWESLLIYQLHPKRFTDITPGALAPLELLADELRPVNRLGRAGYLRRLPVTALQLLPVNEFKSTNSWGYNPAFFFTSDSGYGGPEALGTFVREAHAAGKAVLLDLVYNHMNDSPLTRIAPDVYRNGDAWGDRINNAHPMVREFFRQAIVYLWRTFALDGFRFDATATIIGNMGWEFLGALHSALRAAASASGKRWPYLVGENDPKFWDMTNPAWAVMDGQWALNEVSDLGHAAYDPWQPADDHAGAVKADMDVPQTWVRPFHEANRFGESHDSVSGEDRANCRIAARPPFRLGLQMAKAIGTVPLLSNGVPMLFMGEEVAETRYFSIDNDGPVTNPQVHDTDDPAAATDNTRVLAWFRSLMGLRNDPSKGLRGDDNLQFVRTGHRTVAFTCGGSQRLFVVVTFGTNDQRQDSSWLGLPGGAEYKEIFNSSWPAFQVEFEPERTNGGYDARIQSGQVINLPYIGAIVLERR